MTDDPDDALSWAGDDDAAPRPSPMSKGKAKAAAPSTGLAEGWTAVGNPGQPVDPETDDDIDIDDDDDDSEPTTSSALLIALGILGGIYLLYTIGWAVGAPRVLSDTTEPVADFMFGLGRWLAILAPALWFGVTLWATGGHTKTRVIWLVIGAIVLIPMPLLLGTGTA